VLNFHNSVNKDGQQASKYLLQYATISIDMFQFHLNTIKNSVFSSILHLLLLNNFLNNEKRSYLSLNFSSKILNSILQHDKKNLKFNIHSSNVFVSCVMVQKVQREFNFFHFKRNYLTIYVVKGSKNNFHGFPCYFNAKAYNLIRK